MRILVTGARDCSNPCVVHAVLDHATVGHEQVTIDGIVYHPNCADLVQEKD